MSERKSVTRAVVVGTGLGADRQRAEVSVIDERSIWLTFLGPRGGRQYTLPVSVNGAVTLGTALRQAAESIRGFNR